MSDAAAANAQSSGAEALRAYEHAATLWRELGETRLQAQALLSAAMVRYWSLYDWKGSAEQAFAAAYLYRGLGLRGLYANALFAHGYAQVEVAQLAGAEGDAQFDIALAAYQESLSLHKSLGNSHAAALVENFMGLAYFYRGAAGSDDFRRAEEHYHRAAPLFAAAGEWREELNVRQNLALIDIEEGYGATATRTLEAIISEIPDGKDPQFRGIVLTNLGFARLSAGAFDGALEAFSSALRIHAELKQVNWWEGLALRGLGTTYLALGELDRARYYLTQAFEKSADERRIQASVLASLGNVEYLSANYSDALDLHRRAVEGTASGALRAYRQTFVARDLVALGDFEGALAVGGDALSGPDSDALTKADAALELGHAYLGLGKDQEAAEHFDRALAVYESVGQGDRQAESLRGLSLAAEARGDLPGAISFGEESLQRIEALRTQVSAPELRAFYSAAQRKHYERQIDLLMTAHGEKIDVQTDALAAALSVSERARMRMTVELLAEASTDLVRGLPQDVLERERGLYEELNALRYQRDRLLEGDAADAKDIEDRLGRMTAIENELSLLATEVRHSGHGTSRVPKPLTVTEMQTLLDERSVLVQYALGDERSHAWVVTRDSLQAVELAGRDIITAAATRAYEMLGTYNAADRDLAEVLAELSELVVAPIAPLLQSRERVIFAADGALQYVPFGVLPFWLDGNSEPMLRAFEVTNVPSMSVVAAQREQPRGGPPPRMLAIFADPVFTETDPRIARSPAAALPSQPTAEPFTSRGSVGSKLDRLAATGAEASAIADLVPADSRLVATGLAASRDAVLTADLNEYRIVHFATHGLVDSRYPGLSALALSQFDAQGEPTNGFLRLHDIYALDLNADLVVLSGCETALGREIRGEGLIGLTHGFLYAGARNLVVSLWQVPDRATAELMTRFYGYLLNEGLRPAEALRRAQLAISSDRRWSDPYFWGAFIVVGDS
jgi:CHAT domain-containing protein